MRTAVALLAVLALASAGCDKDKPKPDDTKKVEATPVPSDMVFNDFIPPTGGPSGLHARGDAGLEGGLADIASGNPADQDDPNAASGAADKLKVTDPGADPKAVRKYTFVVGKVDKRILTITQSMTQQAGSQSMPPQELTLKLYVDLTPKTVKKDGATIEAKVTKVELPGAPAQAQQMLAPLAGMSGTFDATSKGEAGEVAFASNPAMKNQLADNVLQGLSQAVQLLLAPLPEAPIGVGAKWELPGQAGDPDQGAKRFAAKDLSADGGTIEATIEMKVPRRAQKTQQGTVFVSVDGKGKYTYQVKWNGIAPHVEGELNIVENIEAGGAPGEPKQQVTRIQKVKHVVEAGK